METVVDSSRHSAVHNLINREHYYSSPKLSDREPRYVAEGPAAQGMGLASLVSPTTPYPNHPPPPYTQNPPLPTHAISGLISPPESHPPESRRQSDDRDMAHNGHRMSLPSIHEALADPKPSGYVPAPSTVITTSLPYSFSQPPTPTTRPFGMEPAYQTTMDRGPQRASPPQQSHPYARPEQGIPPAPYDPQRHPSLPSIRTALPAQSPSGPRPEFPRHEEQRGMAANGYSHPPLQTRQYSGYPTASNPPSASTFSPQSPYNQQRPFPARYGSDYPKHESTPNGDVEYHTKTFGIPVPNPYQGIVKRNLDCFDVESSLDAVMRSSSDLVKISSELFAEAQRASQRGSQSARNPSMPDIMAMERQHEIVASCLRNIRESVQQNMNEQNHNSGGQMSADYEQDDMGQWNEEGKMGYGGPDAKKRRGRAAPPGRCHSCNRAETPEWRRGPDGARTLCNACGLHYAKLTRKNMGNAKNTGSAIRKPMDDGSARPTL